MNKISKQEILVENILNNVGGIKNVKDVYHCATRMRMTLFSIDIVDINKLKNIPNLKGALWSNGELQIIIGAEVSKITELLKKNLIIDDKKEDNKNTDFEIKRNIVENKVSYWRRIVKGVSAIFGPLIPFLVGVGLIMALQQLLIRSHACHEVKKDGVLGVDYNIFDYVLNVISGTGFKLMGVIAIWSTVRYLGGKTPIALALGLIMISPIIPEDGIKLMNIGSWEILIKPFYSTILVFITMGILIAYAQKTMERYFNPVVNFILNPLLTLLIGGLLAFFIIGPIMGIVEHAMLSAFNWFMNLPAGIGTLIVGLTWQPLVVLGVHNILFFAAVNSLVSDPTHPSLFLAAAFAAAWAQMGATIAVGIKSKKTIDKSTAFAAALPGIISGPTESCIYGVNLPRLTPFITGTLSGAIGGWLIGIFNVGLNNLAGLGGIVGFLAYTDKLGLAIAIDLASFGIGILITWLIWVEDKSEKTLAMKTSKKIAKSEFLLGKTDFKAQEIINLLKKISKKEDIKKEYLLKFKNILSNCSSSDNLIKDQLNIIIDNINNETLDNKNKKLIIKELLLIRTERQEKLNEQYKELLLNVKLLKKLNGYTSKQYSLLVHKANLEYSLNHINGLKEHRNAVLFNKGQKLIATNQELKILKGNELVQQSNLDDYKIDKINNIKEKIILIDGQINEKNKELLTITNEYYYNIENSIKNIEKVIEKDLIQYKNQYWNDIHHLEIKEQLVKEKI